MPVQLTDDEIQNLMAEPKPLPENYRERIQLKPKRGHKQAELEFEGSQGSTFRLIFRQSNFSQFDFSIILAYIIPQTNIIFRLRRYNGKSHEHTNKLEGNRFYDFHIHHATQRYQESGLREDAYARPTDRYADFHGAWQCLLADGGFELPPNDQLPLPL